MKTYNCVRVVSLFRPVPALRAQRRQVQLWETSRKNVCVAEAAPLIIGEQNMTHTYAKLLFHLVWSTKNRRAFIDESLKECYI